MHGSDRGNSYGFAYARARDGVEVEEWRPPCSPRSMRFSGTVPTEVELRRGKAQYERNWLHELARIDSRADALGEYATLLGDPHLINTRLSEVNTVEVDAIAAAAAAWLAEIDGALSSTGRTSRERCHSRQSLPPGPWSFPIAQRSQLSNGVEVITFALPGQHVIAAHLIMDLPLSAEDREREGVATICARALTKALALIRARPSLSIWRPRVRASASRSPWLGCRRSSTSQLVTSLPLLSCSPRR